MQTRRPLLALAGLGLVLAACGPFDGGEGDSCDDGVRASDVEQFFATGDAGLWGGDYQRAHPLGDGRTLWTFQDALVGTTGPGEFTHNAAAVQDGECWTTIETPGAESWLFADQTEHKQHWFWPMGSELAPDGATLGLFVAELVEHGDSYLEDVEPLGVLLVTIDTTSLDVLSAEPAAADGTEMFGWSVTSDDDWTYLYSWCLRQWGWSLTGHDPECTADVLLGRVPRGELTQMPEFWDGEAWQGDLGAAASVVDTARGDVLPLQVTYTGGAFLAVSKPGDWYGDTVYVDRADAPYGPWAEIERITIAPKCDPEVCNTYFPSFVPAGDADGELTVAISHNRWEHPPDADPVVYRPTVFRVDPEASEATATTVLTYPDERQP